MAGGDTPKKEKKDKKDKKRKSEVADLGEEPVKPEVVPAVEGSASAEAVAMEVDGEKAAKKAKKEKRKSVGGDVAAEEQDAKVGSLVNHIGQSLRWTSLKSSPSFTYPSMPSRL